MNTAFPVLEALPTSLQKTCTQMLTDHNVVGASIAVVHDGKAYQHCYGVKSITTKLPIDSDTAFNIGSCSKAFVSATIASLVSDGLMSWEDPIRKYVPEFTLYDSWVSENVTLRDLSGNRVGLSREGLCEFGMDPEISAEYIFQALQHTEPSYPFRDRYTYVNFGHRACAVAVERVTGKHFVDVLKERIWGPLGMLGSSGGARAKQELDNIASWHVRVAGENHEVDALFTDQYLGSGGICLSGRDATRWLQLQLNDGLVAGKQVIDAEHLKETHRPKAIATPGKDQLSLFYPASDYGAYALGWAVSDFEGYRMVCHSGSDIGIAAMTVLIPERNIGVAVYMNSIGSAFIPIAQALTAQLLKLPERDWTEWYDQYAYLCSNSPAVVQTPNRALEEYIGEYQHPADGVVKVFLSREGLETKFESAYKFDFRLSPIGDDIFQMDSDHVELRSLIEIYKDTPTMEFVVEDGMVTSLKSSLAGSSRVFRKV